MSMEIISDHDPFAHVLIKMSVALQSNENDTQGQIELEDKDDPISELYRSLTVLDGFSYFSLDTEGLSQHVKMSPKMVTKILDT